MSWLDTKQLTLFASTALKSAQKKIDEVLDIKEEELGKIDQNCLIKNFESEKPKSQTEEIFFNNDKLNNKDEKIKNKLKEVFSKNDLEMRNASEAVTKSSETVFEYPFTYPSNQSIFYNTKNCCDLNQNETQSSNEKDSESNESLHSSLPQRKIDGLLKKSKSDCNLVQYKKNNFFTTQKENNFNRTTTHKNSKFTKKEFGNAEKLLKEKDSTISELRLEGEKLSKELLRKNNILKKSSAKEKENEKEIISLKGWIEDQTLKIGQFQKDLKNLTQQEKENKNIIKSFEAENNQLCREIEDLKIQYEQLNQENLTYRETLEKNSKKLTEINIVRKKELGNLEKACEDKEELQKLQRVLESLKNSFSQKKFNFTQQLENKKKEIISLEKKHSAREHDLRLQIDYLQQRLQEEEDKSQSLASSLSEASQPFLHQIQNIQSTFSAQNNNHEIVEKSLLHQLIESQKTNEELREINRSTHTLNSTLTHQLNSFRSQLNRLQINEENLQLMLKNSLSKNSSLELEQIKFQEEKKKLIEEMKKKKDSFTKEQGVIAKQLEAEKEKRSLEEKKNQSLLLELEKNKTLELYSNNNDSQDQKLAHQKLKKQNENTPTYENFHSSMYENLRGLLGTPLVENLQSIMNRKERDINQLKFQLDKVENSREKLVKDLSEITDVKCDLESQLELLSNESANYKALNKRYNALLQMYGEKLEEIDELRMDLQDFKEMYKQQMEQIIKIESPKAN